MAQYIIPATFADDTWFKTGLSPIITIREWDDKNEVYKDIINTTMEDKGMGDYTYTFMAYDKYKLYTFKIDGGSDELTSRYLTGNNELDYYSNKQDRGTRVMAWFVWFDDRLTEKMLKKIVKELDIRKPKEIDLSEVKLILEDIRNKEYPKQDNLEILEKIDLLDEKDDKTEIISAIKSNSSDILKTNKENWELTAKLYEQIKEDRELINWLREYIEKLIKRWDIEKDEDFKNLIDEIDEWEELIKMLCLELDDDFISIISD